MPKRSLTIHACALGVMLAVTSQAQAGSSSWNGSYAADDSCFCVGSQSRDIDSLIVPTPVGGQSVTQVCERIGEGPTLQKINGKFNYTVFPDAQCGHGPLPKAEIKTSSQCVGTLGVAGEDCSRRGPRWKLDEAYAETKPVPKVGISDTAVTGGSRHIKPPTSTVAQTKDVTVEQKKVVVKRSAPKRVKAAPKVAVVETREQLRARQLEQLAQARLRASQAEQEELARQEALAKQEATSKAVEGLLPETKTESVATVADTTSTPSTAENTPTSVAALKVPAQLRRSSSDFDYIEGAPVTYDFGGAGISVAASKSSHNRMQYVLNAAVADTYREAALGLGMFFTPKRAERLTLLFKAGVEYGNFNFRNDSVTAELSDSGVFVGLASRFAVTRALELQAGVSYSSFFEGDAVGFGAAFYHLTSKLDLTAKAEAGDNDLLGFGIRYHY